MNILHILTGHVLFKSTLDVRLDKGRDICQAIVLNVALVDISEGGSVGVDGTFVVKEYGEFNSVSVGAAHGAYVKLLVVPVLARGETSCQVDNHICDLLSVLGIIVGVAVVVEAIVGGTLVAVNGSVGAPLLG